MSMYAVIEESGGQRKVMQGDEFLVDLIDGGAAEAGRKLTFDRVLLLSGEGVAGGSKIGEPYLKGASVSAEIVEPLVMGEKLYIYKHRPKSTYKRKTGHRQRYTKVRVTGMTG